MTTNSKAYIFFIGLILLYLNPTFCQNQPKSDSLKRLYYSGNYKIPEYIMLAKIAQLETNPDSAFFYSNLLIKKASLIKEKDSSLKALKIGYLAKGNALFFKGNNSEAVESFLNGLDFANETKDYRTAGLMQISIADSYSSMQNNEFAEKYYVEGIEVLRKIHDSTNLASALLNYGDWLITVRRYDESLISFNESSSIYALKDNQLGKAYNLGNIGIVHAEQGKHQLAEDNINEAIAILEELEDYYPVSVYLTYLSDVYVGKDNYDLAFKYAKRSLELAKNYGLKEQLRDANLKLYELNTMVEKDDLALEYYKGYIDYRDSIRNIEEVQKIGNAVTSAAQAETALAVQKQKTQRIILFATVGVLLLIGLLAYGLFRRNRFVQATNKIIAKEKERSDHLLLNILPEDTAEELKEKGSVAAKKYDAVTVLFSDFKGFTSYAENLSPEELVQTIDYYFTSFDAIMEKYGLEKIKTIGDAYMAVGGLSFDNANQANEMILAAKEMNAFVTKAKSDTHTTATFDIRIGINTGPVVAGVVGTKKFAYDIWGDTVNIAARMESSSEAGRINISENTYEIVKDDFKCDYRGELSVKNRGSLKMHFVNF